MHVILLSMLQFDKVSKRSDCVSLKKIINNVYITRTHGIVLNTCIFRRSQQLWDCTWLFFCKRWKSNANHWM